MILKAQSKPSISVAYFYCKDGDTARDSCNGIFRAVLAQLLEQNPDIVPYFNSHELTLTLDPLKSAGLKALVRNVFKVLNMIYLVIDGLDEIGRDERKEFFDIILPLVKSQFNEDAGCRIKLFIGSRGEDDIRANLSSIRSTWRKFYEITGDDNHKDIAFYVSHRVEELGNKFRLDDSRRQEIFKDICSRAGGAFHYITVHISLVVGVSNPRVSCYDPSSVMFLLAKLILDNLMNQTSLQELDEELKPEILPSELRNA